MITVVEGHILLRYWKKNVREGMEDDLVSDPLKKPCRFEFHCSGLEVFLYNRSSIYDWIREEYGLERKSKEKLDVDSPGMNYC